MGSFGVTGWHNIAKAAGPGVTIGRSGASYGVVARTTKDYWPLNTCLFVDDFHGNNPNWVYFCLSQIDFRAYNSGSAQPSLNRNYIKHIRVSVPPLEEQERIAVVLGAFDDLIETNRRAARDLESLAQSCASQASHPVPLREVADVKHLRQRRPDGVVDHFSIPAYDSGYLPTRESSESILSGKQVLESASVLISRLNPSTERTWMAYPDGAVPAVCSPEFTVVRGSGAVSAEVLWALTSSGKFWDQMRGSVGGTTNSRQRVDKAAVSAFAVGDPRELSPQAVDFITRGVQAAADLRREAAEVSRQRDGLLPLLISGKVRVRDLEAVVP